MAAGLEAVGTMRLRTTNATDICINEFFINFGQGLHEVHEVVESFLNIESTAFQEQSRTISLYFSEP